MPETTASPALRLAAIFAGLAAVHAAILWVMGQPPICPCGTVRLFAPDVLGPENSQQVADWYTPSHLIHGVIFFFAIRLLAPRLPLAAAFAIALTVELAWEIVENSPAVIDHYRSQALSPDYRGDSILNSVSDLAAAALGFLFASRVPWWTSLSAAVALEILTAALIRDGLLLNVIQFVYPMEAISVWQQGLT